MRRYELQCATWHIAIDGHRRGCRIEERLDPNPQLTQGNGRRHRPVSQDPLSPYEESPHHRRADDVPIRLDSYVLAPLERVRFHATARAVDDPVLADTALLVVVVLLAPVPRRAFGRHHV